MDKLKVNVLLQRTAELEKDLAAKTRELEVEAALERLRVRAMSMQSSVELAAVVKLMYTELRTLDESLNRCMIMIFDVQTEGVIWWIVGEDEAVTDRGYRVPSSNCPLQLAYLKGWKQRQERWQYTIEGEEKKDWDEFLFTQTELSGLPATIIQNMRSFEKIFLSASFAGFGGLTSGSVEQLNTASFEILVRFSRVFDLIYTRFNDLKKAEVQAREAQIQLALERVRARTMAMQKSNELSEVAELLFKQVNDLGIKTWTTGFNVWSKDNDSWVDYLTNPLGGFLEPYTVDTSQFETLIEVSEARKRGDEFFVQTVEGEKLKELYRQLSNFGDKKQFQKIQESGFQFPSRQIHHFVFGSEVSLMFITYEPVPEAHDIFIRFGYVFEQTYTRFLDLQKAEAQAKEAQIQLALERVRARTMAMQKSDELTDVAAVLFQQVSDLGIKAWTTGFNVWSDDNTSYTDYITSPQGGFIEPYTIDAIRFPAFSEISDARKRGEKFYVSYLDGEMLKQTYLELAKFGDKNQYEKLLEGGFQFPERQFNHFVFGAKVSLLFITYEPMSEVHEIFKRFGAVFEQSYIRFIDLQKAEAQAIRVEQDLIEIKAARKKAEDTLTELRATQQQLIQKEKMASLGELTAGIAHEIQNPLNFVNNFSEVNKELLTELKEEAEKGNIDEVKTIANDVIENEEKINHHGKRADAIVKGMLQHSKQSKGVKEPTDINKLADEYLRLSFHGLRAKDKNFNADYKTDFDESIGKINIVPQDIGRVLLNLFNNAFYAVNEKKKLMANGYQPIAEVKTRRINDKVEIIVSDNGNGVPQNIIDKIFQPFFTTKPTGEGTGLGLSLSYDIIKAHGGEIKVKIKENEGSEFIVQLPI